MIRSRRARNGAASDNAKVRVRYSEPPLWAGAAALKPSLHDGHVWHAARDLHFAEPLDAVPFALAEALNAASCLPLALAPGAVPRPMIILRGQGSVATSLIKGGRLSGHYMPAVLRFYPFMPLMDPQDHDLVVAGDLAGRHIQPGCPGAGWQDIFDDKGQLAPATAMHLQDLARWQAGRDAALTAARALARAGVLCPAPGFSPGWRSVDLARLAALPAEVVADLHRTGALGLAYALVTAAAHLPRVVQSLTTHDTAEVTTALGQDFIAAMGRAQSDTAGAVHQALALSSEAVAKGQESPFL